MDNDDTPTTNVVLGLAHPEDYLGINACGATVTISLHFVCKIYLLSNPVECSHPAGHKLKTGIKPVLNFWRAHSFPSITNNKNQKHHKYYDFLRFF